MSRPGLARREASSNSGTRAAINDQVSLGARGGRKMWEHSMTDLALKSEVPVERVLLRCTAAQRASAAAYIASGRLSRQRPGCR
jgi:hypothetical protein